MTTNSGHEGTNIAIKAGPSCVFQQHGIDKSVKIQVDTNSNKFDLYQQHMASALFGRATLSNFPTVNNLSLPAEFMLKLAVEECKGYASWRTSPYKWLVVLSVDLVHGSKFQQERGVLVGEALDKIISIEKANIAPEKPPPRGTLVSGCPVGKVRKTNVLSWNF